MANVKITELTAYTNPDTTDVLPIVDVGADVTKKVSIENLLKNASSGTFDAPGIAFDGDSNTGIYRPGEDQVAISTNGQGRLFIDSSGNVGVGTTGPVAKVQVSVANDQTDQANTLAIRGTSGSWAAHLGATTEGGALVARGNVSTQGSLIFGSTDGSYASYTERARIDSSGRLLVGTSSARSNFFNTSTFAPGLQLEGATDQNRFVSIVGSNSGGTGGTLILASQKSGGIGGNTIVSNGGQLGAVSFQGNDGTEFVEAARIQVEVDGTPGANDMPGRLVFSTTADGASSPTERMRIDSDGNIGFGSGEYNLGAQKTISINPSEGLIGFGMDGRNTLVTGEAGCYIFSGGPSGGDFAAGDLIIQSRSNISRDIVFATGATPAVRMTIAGSGNVDVVGAFSKGSGSFKIDHPLPEKKDTHHLVHSFIEGPQADLIYRGHISLVEGVATVNLDEAARMTEGTFEALCTNVCCFTSNESDWTPVRGHVSGNILTIEAQDLTSTAKVCWMVVGERKDQHMLDNDWTDENGKVITEPLKAQ